MNDETNMTSPAARTEPETNTGQRCFEDLPAAAQRALREAEDRRSKMTAEEEARKAEIGGRGGKDPARYGDWEVKGVAVDF